MSKVFNMSFDDQNVDTICTITNAEAPHVVQDFKAKALLNKMKIWIDVDLVETRVFFGVQLIDGVLHCQKKTISEMWATAVNIC